MVRLKEPYANSVQLMLISQMANANNDVDIVQKDATYANYVQWCISKHAQSQPLILTDGPSKRAVCKFCPTYATYTTHANNTNCF